MSPIDDELRAALHGRATVLTPSPDPLAGIERRARRMRRNRAATAVAGSALAVAAIALVVPALSPGGTAAPVVPGTSPTAVVATPAPSAFSFADPWPYRGDPDLVVQRELDTYAREWAVTRGVPADQVEWVPLFGEVYVPSQRPQVVYAARVGTQAPVVGLATSTESGPEFGDERPFTDGGDALLLLPTGGDEVGRLFALSAPDPRLLEYAADGAMFEPMTAKAPGVGLTALEGDTSRAKVRLVSADGSTLTADVPTSETAPTGDEPDNLLGWPFRGVHDEALEQRAADAYAASQGGVDVETRVLSTGGTDGGLVWTLLEGWVPGERAQVFGWVERPDGSTEPVLQPLNEPDEQVVVLLLTGVPGRSTDELVVVPSPLTGQVLYTDDAGTQRPVETAPGYDSVVLVDRARDAQADSLVVLDGDGDLDRPLYDGSVFTLLCGEKGCG